MAALLDWYTFSGQTRGNTMQNTNIRGRMVYSGANPRTNYVHEESQSTHNLQTQPDNNSQLTNPDNVLQASNDAAATLVPSRQRTHWTTEKNMNLMRLYFIATELETQKNELRKKLHTAYLRETCEQPTEQNVV